MMQNMNEDRQITPSLFVHPMTITIFFFHKSCIMTLFWLTCRVLNVKIGETSRLAWLGVEADPLLQSDALLKAYNRPSETTENQSSSKWFISKNAIVSGLGLLGIKQGNGENVVTPPKARRKRIVRKKASPSSA